MVKAMTSVQKNLLSRTITHAWIALMRTFQRMQGKGNPKATQIRGSRGVFTDARRRGRFTSEVWVAAALLEYHTNDSDLANKLFDRAMKLFPEDERLALKYIKWLTSVNDHTSMFMSPR
jgi:cleavage stimulation factor subunit 3